MKLHYITICMTVAFCGFGRSAYSDDIQTQTHVLTLDVAKEGWREGQPEDIEAVLRSVTNRLWGYFPEKPSTIIRIIPAKSAPQTLYKRGPDGEFNVELSAKDLLWSQYSYQFGHEFCHVMAATSLKDNKSSNYWFEEALCDTSSLFVLKRMAKKWETAPPYPDWTDYAPALKGYFDDLMKEEHRDLPPNISLAQWYKSNREELKSEKKLTNRSELVAKQLLPFF